MQQYSPDFSTYLQPTSYIDSTHPLVVEFARHYAQVQPTDTLKAIALYYAVRDTIRYTPYGIDLRQENLSASRTIAIGSGYCVEKAIVLAAAARHLGIPSKLGFANVRNHLATPKFLALLRTDVFVFHGYVSLYLNDKWVKCTPAFNADLCEKFGVAPLDFDGEHDAVFQAFDQAGNQFMEYLNEHGEFADMPHELFVSELRREYPHFFDGLDARQMVTLPAAPLNDEPFFS